MLPTYRAVGRHGETEAATKIASVTLLVHPITFDLIQFLGFGDFLIRVAVLPVRHVHRDHAML